jgi:uncharacterized protein (DUF2147 family)
MSKSLVIRAVLLMLGFLLLCDILLADEAQTKIAGNWLTETKDGIIQISQATDGTLQGRIIGGNEPGKLDTKNPDATKRTLPLRGQVILYGLKYDGDGKWSGGSIYDPNGGSTYRCKVELNSDGTLKVRGFVGVALLGKSQRWTRYTGTSMDLPKAP